MLITADCEGGNSKHIRQVGEDHWAANVVADQPGGYRYYFHLRLVGDDRPHRIQLDVYPDPDISDGGIRTFAGDVAAIVWVRRGQSWHAVPYASFAGEDTLEAGADGYRITLSVAPREELRLSNVLPIFYSELGGYLEELTARYGTYARVGTLGESAEGRLLHYLSVAEGEGLERRPRVVIAAGEHATEAAGAWAVRGIGEYLLSSVPEARAWRRRYRFELIPMTNPDGAVLGRPCFTAQGANLIQSYADAANGTSPGVAEASALWRWLRAQPVALYLNFHGYVGPRGHGDPPYEGCYVVPSSVYSDGDRGRQVALIDALRFNTAALSQHQQFPIIPATHAAHQLALLDGTPTALYEPNMVNGRSGCMQCGITVLRAAMMALEGGGNSAR